MTRPLFHELLTDAQRRLDLSDTAMSKLLKVSTPTYQAWVSGEVLPAWSSQWAAETVIKARLAKVAA